MRKLASAISILVAAAALALGADVWVNLQTGQVGVPEVIGSTHHPIANPPFLLENGYRMAEEPSKPAEGYERLAPVTWRQDPTNSSRALPEYHDTSIADRLEREAAEDLERNFSRYMYQDAFLLVCDRIAGNTNHTKLPMETLTVAFLQIRASDKDQYEKLRDGLQVINAALTRYETVWWDNCTWNSHTGVVQQATSLFNSILQ